MKDIFVDNVITGTCEAADMKRIDKVSSLICLIIERYCGENDTALVLKGFHRER